MAAQASPRVCITLPPESTYNRGHMYIIFMVFSALFITFVKTLLFDAPANVKQLSGGQELGAFALAWMHNIVAMSHPFTRGGFRAYYGWFAHLLQ